MKHCVFLYRTLDDDENNYKHLHNKFGVSLPDYTHQGVFNLLINLDDVTFSYFTGKENTIAIKNAIYDSVTVYVNGLTATDPIYIFYHDGDESRFKYDQQYFEYRITHKNVIITPYGKCVSTPDPKDIVDATGTFLPNDTNELSNLCKELIKKADNLVRYKPNFDTSIKNLRKAFEEKRP